MIYLLDTDMAVMVLRGMNIRSPHNASQRARQATGNRIFDAAEHRAKSGHVVGLSAITVAELEFGAAKAVDPELERERVERTFAPFLHFAFEPGHATRCYRDTRFILEKSGQTIGPNDLLIAAHALALGAVLVTNNTKEFKRVKGLKCENWSTS
ncbi:MAG: PIN domain-containing protein [Verrucomicrobiaceae bacterium]|nr:PIN domain-containing protein [Verrucomicrobiaceae bacterium]